MWHAPRVQTQRLTASLAAGLVALAALAGCRSAPDVAAYVGDEQIAVEELQSAVDQRLADPELAVAVAGSEDALTRRVLGLLIEGEIHDAAAARYDVQVTDAEVTARIRELLGDDDPEAVYDRLAQQGVGPADVRESVRQQLVRLELAAATGRDEAVEEAALRARYQEVRDQLAEVEFGYVTVPDQATADAVVQELAADPGSYPEVAARFPGPYTLAELRRQPVEQLPQPLAEQLAPLEPGGAFSMPVPEAGGVVVGFKAGVAYPSFEELRPRLEAAAADEVEAAVQPLLEEVRTDLEITVNPRYGTFDEGRLLPPTQGVVEILEEEPAAAEGLRVPSAD